MARPDPPANVTATDGDPTIVITWDAVMGAATYGVWRSTVEGDDGFVIGITDELTWTDLTALDNILYWYAVNARSSSQGCSLLSAQDSGYAYPVPFGPPDTPVDLEGTVEN